LISCATWRAISPRRGAFSIGSGRSDLRRRSPFEVPALGVRDRRRDDAERHRPPVAGSSASTSCTPAPAGVRPRSDGAARAASRTRSRRVPEARGSGRRGSRRRRGSRSRSSPRDRTRSRRSRRSENRLDVAGPLGERVPAPLQLARHPVEGAHQPPNSPPARPEPPARDPPRRSAPFRERGRDRTPHPLPIVSATSTTTTRTRKVR